ncbi:MULTISPECIES: hydrolase 1, exosortase A system-associated [unclassified Acidovorax]|jgi:exosortase A-associated hydrolase 1|uniref:hydrolase 1, exosortase A system-associated n=1 Tax=unclassified Acidovorax TaxID=2684926 RepID=UPI000B3FF1FF|nr:MULTISPECIES: hydrolase 1, exosortase A system-associated [unclassified Acidovorax]MBU4424160.1 hydrolase 1, exosortase A system-associated [Gammaproteobacteria bacterium]
MTPPEHPLRIAGDGFDILGILSLPESGTPLQRTGVVIVVGGAQYRVGSHRQFVRLARHLATAGYPVLRFDFPGMGDSPGDPVPFEDTAPHIAAAIGAMQQAANVDRTVLWGLCDGASASLLYVQTTQDPRVTGLALLNPWVRSAAGLARAQVKHYYRQRLREPGFWRKLLQGGVGWRALHGLWNNLRTMRQTTAQPLTFQERMAQGWRAFPAPVLLLLSERDLTAQEFAEHANSHASWAGWAQKITLTRHMLPHADHTCSAPQSQHAVQALVMDWLESTAHPST